MIMELEKYSLGVGDRFGREGAAQLRAIQKAQAVQVQVVPVWNKSNREHTIIGTSPDDARREADEAARTCRWTGSYYVDADHIGLTTVDRFLASSNFFTIDVADYIGKPANPESVASFVKAMGAFRGRLTIPGVDTPFDVTDTLLTGVAHKYLFAVEEAGKVYRHIADKKGAGNFIPEVSVDESNSPQTPVELFFILGSIAREGIPIQTIAPKFTGAFLKGIDYVGDVQRFAREFEDDLAVLAHAVQVFRLPRNLKLSVHSGSDKFSLYPTMNMSMRKYDAGLHVKTAGTTWLEEIIGLASTGGDGLTLAKDIYTTAWARYDELCKPYLPVINIDRQRLPAPREVESWTATEYVERLRHDRSCPRYDVNFRQLVHVSFRLAAEMGRRYTDLLQEFRGVIEDNVTNNLFRRHIQPLFLGQAGDEQRDAGQGTARAPDSMRKAAGI
jgi:hypothetical protein